MICLTPREAFYLTTPSHTIVAFVCRLSYLMAVNEYPSKDKGPLILGVTLAVTTAALLTLFARLYVRVEILHNELDDLMSWHLSMRIVSRISSYLGPSW